MKRQIEFIYFDLGNVILHFEQPLICKQIAEVADVPRFVVHQFFAEQDYQTALETGLQSFDEVYELFADFISHRPDKVQIQLAANNIFHINSSIVPIVAGLKMTGHRLGVLSNTSEAHWDFVTDGRFALLPAYFERFALSFAIKAMKPDPRIYAVAAELAGVPPESVFFVDDRSENVLAARQAGWAAVPFTTPVDLARALREQGVRFNY